MILMPKSSPHRDECEWAEQMGGKHTLGGIMKVRRRGNDGEITLDQDD